MAQNVTTKDTVTNTIGLLDISALGTLAEYRIGAALQFDAPAQYNTRATPSSATVTLNLAGAVSGTMILCYFNHGAEPTWPAAETLINTALSNCAGLIPDGYYITSHTGKSLQKQELTVAQASPLTKGTPTNATGNDDDAHSNYIAGQLVAEEIRNNLVAEGII